VEEDRTSVWTTWHTDSFVTPPGSRFRSWSATNLASVEIAGERQVGVALPTTLADQPPFLPGPVAGRRILTMNAPAIGGPSVSWFNRVPNEHITMADVFQFLVDTVEEWIVRNRKHDTSR